MIDEEEESTPLEFFEANGDINLFCFKRGWYRNKNSLFVRTYDNPWLKKHGIELATCNGDEYYRTSKEVCLVFNFLPKLSVIYQKMTLKSLLWFVCALSELFSTFG